MTRNDSKLEGNKFKHSPPRNHRQTIRIDPRTALTTGEVQAGHTRVGSFKLKNVACHGLTSTYDLTGNTA
jgi:hypothetical protein